MKLPTISVVLPCLNRALYIQTAIESVLSQPYPAIELIVVDGGSSDETLEIVREFVHRDPRVRYVSEPDQGVYDAVNKGLRLATGDLIGWLNSDDYYTVDLFGQVASVFQTHPGVEVICCNASIRGNGREGDQVRCMLQSPDRTRVSFRTITRSGVFLNACFLTRTLYDRIGLYSTTERIAGDRDYLIRLAVAEPAAVHMDHTAYVYQEHEGSLTLANSVAANRRRHLENLALNRRWLSAGKLPYLGRRYCAYQCAASRVALGLLELGQHRPFSALRLLGGSVWHGPWDTAIITGRILSRRIRHLLTAR